MWSTPFIVTGITDNKTLAIGAIHVDSKGAKSVYIPATKTRVPVPPGMSNSTAIANAVGKAVSEIKISV
jgi:hypothetical protein